MLASLGHTFLLLAAAAAIWNIAATGVAFRPAQAARRGVWLESAHNAAFAVWGLLLGAAVILWCGFLSNNFSLAYVWENSSREQPLVFKISALWGGQGGSLLLWALILASYALVVSRGGRKSGQELSPVATAVISATTLFFVCLIAWAASPFAVVDGAIPADGRGMNPLLQNYWMQIHPPTLYTGYVGCTVPFAFAVAALLHRRFDEDWVTLIRRWVLFTWVVLTVGIVLGGVWAYETLGWGGYWAWDPVENASLMPWLSATAFLHSIMLQGRRGLLKNWNIALVTLTFLLSVFGTFLTRSGVVQSVHSFAESGIGGYFLGFLGFVLVLTLGLILWRREELHSDAKIESALSREGAFMLNNWLLLAATFAVLWGTVFPTLSEAILNQRRVVDKSYFCATMAPIGLLLLALTGIGPLLAWRRANWRGVWKALKFPLLWAIAFLPVAWLGVQFLDADNNWFSKTGATSAFFLAFFVLLAIGWEVARGIQARRRLVREEGGREGFSDAAANLVAFNPARYGGYIVHLGVALMFVGFTGSSVFKIEHPPVTLKKGETTKIGEYTLRFDGLARPAKKPDNLEEQIVAPITVFQGSQQITASERPLDPRVDIFKAKEAPDPRTGEQNNQHATRPAILSSPANDLYLVLNDYDPQKNTASIKAWVNPLVMWIWVSVGFFVVGTIVAMIPPRRRAPVVVPVAPVRQHERTREEIREKVA